MSGFIQQQQHKTDFILGKPANPNTPIVELFKNFSKWLGSLDWETEKQVWTKLYHDRISTYDPTISSFP